MIMIGSVLDERLARRDEAVREITQSWGGAQTVVGPVLVVPYRVRLPAVPARVAGERGVPERIEIRRAFFLPRTLEISGEVLSERRYRGIYDAIVYRGVLELSGVFSPPEVEALGLAGADWLWEDAAVSLGVSDLRGTREELVLRLGDEAIVMMPGARGTLFGNGVTAAAGAVDWRGGEVPFSIRLPMDGSGELLFAPVGVRTTVALTSDWPDPGFRGAFLPETREIGPDGFSALWQVSHYGRPYPQQWKEEDNFSHDPFRASFFGVGFVPPIDSYRSVERATKYAVLILVLVFTTYFLFEVVAGMRIHPFQYIMVGAALCLFFLGLLSFSEFVGFGLAYLAAAFLSWGLISGYSLAVLKSGRRTLIIAGLLALIYAVVFVILQLRDHALLLGTLGLFAALAAVMYVTRRVDWYGRNPEAVRPGQ